MALLICLMCPSDDDVKVIDQESNLIELVILDSAVCYL